LDLRAKEGATSDTGVRSSRRICRVAIISCAVLMFGFLVLPRVARACDEPQEEAFCDESGYVLLLDGGPVTISNQRTGIDAEWFKLGDFAGFYLNCAAEAEEHELEFTDTDGLVDIEIEEGPPHRVELLLTGTCGETGTHTISGRCADHGTDDYTYYAVDLDHLSVSGATEGQTPGVYWTEKAPSGDVVITAVLDPEEFGDGQAPDMPFGMLSWTGGTAVPNSYQRKVSKTAAAATTVTGKVAAERSVVILVMDVTIDYPTQTASSFTHSWKVRNQGSVVRKHGMARKAREALRPPPGRCASRSSDVSRATGL